MWAALRQERRDAVIVFVAADPEPVGVAAILKALAKSGLDVTGCWIFADLFTERLRYEVDPGWRGELPYTVLITRTGGISTISGVVEPKRLREWLDKHLPRR
jgi:hypothetical protein